MKVNLVIPAAGAGSRFCKDGIIVPKPLINLSGKPFFYWSVISVSKYVEIEDLIFVVLREHVNEWNIDKEIYSYFPEAKVVILNEMTKGAAETAAKGIEFISDDNTSPILINDCDHFFMSNDLYRFLNENKQDYTWSGALLTFKSNDPKYSFVKYDNNGLFSGTKEKEVVSTDAICGAYLFGDKELYMKAYNKYLIRCPYNELFVSGLYNVLEGFTKIFTTDAHIPFGVPKEYEVAKKFFDMFK